MSTTKAAFRLATAQRVGLVSTFTTTSAGDSGGNTFIALGLQDVFPDELTDMWVMDINGVERVIVNYDVAEGIAFVNRPFSAQVASGVTLYIYRRFAPSDFDNALRLALDDVYPYLAQLLVDTSVETVAGTYEYTVPTTIRDLERMMGGLVEIEVNTVEATYPYRELRMWDTRRSTTAYTLTLNPREFVAERTLRITGLAPLPFPSTEATAMLLDSPQTTLLQYATLYNLYSTAQGAPKGDKTAAAQMEAKYRALYDQNKDVWGLILRASDLKSNDTGTSDGMPFAYYATPS